MNIPIFSFAITVMLLGDVLNWEVNAWDKYPTVDTRRSAVPSFWNRILVDMFIKIKQIIKLQKWYFVWYVTPSLDNLTTVENLKLVYPLKRVINTW